MSIVSVSDCLFQMHTDMKQVDVPAQEFDEDEEQRLINEGSVCGPFYTATLLQVPNIIKNTKHGRRTPLSSTI